MRLISLQVVGFQSFADTGNLSFSNGINLVVGQNNVGKSSLLRALRPSLPDDRHRDSTRYLNYLLPKPSVNMELNVSGAELYNTIMQSNKDYWIRSPALTTSREVFFDELFSSEELLFRCTVEAGAGSFDTLTHPSHGHSFADVGGGSSTRIIGQAGSLHVIELEPPGRDTFIEAVHDLWKSSMFFFSAERYGIGRSHFGHAERLEPNASNLPVLLLTLSGSRGTIFSRLVEHIREIFPTVGNISVGPDPSNHQFVEIRIWPTEQMVQRELSFALDNSGTGVSQVLAILCAVMTADNTVIVIDEINSFLHPLAVKSLLRILQTDYSNHQYIISTHAPEVISFSNPTKVHLVRRSGYVSRVEDVSLSSVANLREIASHLGVSMSDVFAAEKVVWVEGPTEELCFPYLFRETVGPVPRGLLMLSVSSTGDFSRKRDRKLIFDIYSRLSAAAASLTVTVSFSFDSEKLSITEQQDMQRESRGKIHFLPRRHLECYLIDPGAVLSFIQEKDGKSRIDVLQIEAEIRALGAQKKFSAVDGWNGDINDPEWLSSVDAANLLKAVIQNLTEGRVSFHKKDDSLHLMKHLVTHAPERLRELTNYVSSIVTG